MLNYGVVEQSPKEWKWGGPKIRFCLFNHFCPHQALHNGKGTYLYPSGRGSFCRIHSLYHFMEHLLYIITENVVGSKADKIPVSTEL